VRSPDFIAVVCIFHRANRSRVASHLDKNGVKPSFSPGILKKVVRDPVHELVPSIRSTSRFMSARTFDSDEESRTTGGQFVANFGKKQR